VNVFSSESTIVLSLPMSLPAAFTCTQSCTAWPSEETSTPWIPSTPLTFRTAAAFVLGALARRNALLSLLTSLPREGNAPLTTIATTSQNATTSQRKRTTPLASVSKVLSIENLFME